MPIISGGGGGGGGFDPTPPVTLVSGGAAASLVVDANAEFLLQGNGGPRVIVQDNGGLGSRLDILDNQTFRTATLLSGHVAGDHMLQLNDGNFNRVLLSDTLFLFRINSAPADAAIQANQLTLWYDSTNGASKLMIKAKQADGTVKTASVALA